MPCLLVLIALFLPRVVIVLLALFTDFMRTAFSSPLLPFLGFIFVPYTTLAYAAAINIDHGVTGFWWAILFIALLADLGTLGGGDRVRRQRVA